MGRVKAHWRGNTFVGEHERSTRGRSSRSPADVARRSAHARGAAVDAELTHAAANGNPDWTDDGDETADVSAAAADKAVTTALLSRLDPYAAGRAASVAAGPSVLRAEKVADVVTSGHEAWGIDLSAEDHQAIMAGVASSRDADADEAKGRFAAAHARAQKALDEEPLPAENDAAFVNAYDLIEEVSGSVMTRAEIEAMAEAVSSKQNSEPRA